MCRYGIAQMMRSYSQAFPWATLTANALSCIVLGALVAWSMKNGLADSTKLLLLVGFCGGFSTFSTFTNETYQLWESGELLYALANIGGSLLLCLCCLYLGMKLVS